MSGEIVPSTDLTEEEARKITNSIRQHVDISLMYISKAYDGRAWIALDYPSWADYIAGEIGEHVHLPRDERRGAVLELRDAGMSTRAISSAIGVSVGTVHSDITCSELNTSNASSEWARIRDAFADGRTFTIADAAEAISPVVNPMVAARRTGKRRSGRPNAVLDGLRLIARDMLDSRAAATVGNPQVERVDYDEYRLRPVVSIAANPDDEIVDAEIVEATPEPRQVTGTDGKTYRPKPTTTRRPDITREMSKVADDLRKATNRLLKLSEDDRFDRNVDTIGGRFLIHEMLTATTVMDKLARDIGVTR